MNVNRNLILVLLAACVVLLAFAAGLFYTQIVSPRTTSELPEEFDTLGEVWMLLSESYVNKSSLDPADLSQGAIEGMLEALGDPYTSYLESYAKGIAALEGAFEGIGAVVTLSDEDDQLTVVSPIAGGPAEREGVRAGDKILEIDGESTSDMSLAEAVLKIRGPKGTAVNLTILHAGEDTPVTIVIVRDEIKLDSVYLDMLPDNIAHIRISQFAGRTPSELTSVLSDALQGRGVSIILDLRGNPGGYLHIVTEVADEFLDGGIILYQADDSGNIIEEFTASAGGLAIDVPMVVLVDGGSASGSEVLAGALQDRGRSALIGTTTYGKGSVNIPYMLSDGSALYMTTSRWLTPNKYMIEGVGLTPDFEVEITEDDIASGEDPQLDFAIEYLLSQQ